MGSNQGRLFVVSGPSGVGKGSMLSCLFERVSNVVHSVSATTRQPRPGEVDGINYHFLTREAFEVGIATSRFLEHAQYGTNLYGTPKDKVLEQRDLGKDVFLEIEVQGAKIVQQALPEAILIYIMPPSHEELERRLRGRQTETEEVIQMRLRIAKEEIESLPFYDYLIINDDLKTASEALISIVIAERHRIRS